MGFFKSKEEKEKKKKKKIKERWNETAEYNLGINYEESGDIEKTVHKALIDAMDEDGRVPDFAPINVLFPDLTPKQKVMILYYARWYKENIELGKF